MHNFNIQNEQVKKVQSAWLKSDPQSAPHFSIVATQGSEETPLEVTSWWTLNQEYSWVILAN